MAHSAECTPEPKEWLDFWQETSQQITNGALRIEDSWEVSFVIPDYRGAQGTTASAFAGEEQQDVHFILRSSALA